MTYRKKYPSKFWCTFHSSECRGPRYRVPEGIVCEIGMLHFLKEADLDELYKYANERIGYDT